MSASQRIVDASDELAIAAFLVDMVSFIMILKTSKSASENEVDNCCFSQIEPAQSRKLSFRGSFSSKKKQDKEDNDPVLDN